MAKDSRNRNMLNQQQTYQLMKYLQDNKEKIEKAKMGPTRAAAKVTKALGFDVTPRNVKTACTSMGDDAPKLLERRRGESADPDGALKQACFRLRRAVRLLAERLASFGDENVEEDIRQIISGVYKEQNGEVTTPNKRHDTDDEFARPEA